MAKGKINLKARPPKVDTGRSSPIQTKIVNTKGYGKEPEIKEIKSTTEMIRALSWYNIMADTADAKKWLQEWAATTNDKNIIGVVRNVTDKHINRTACHVARLLSRGTKLLDSDVAYLTKYVSSLATAKAEKESEPVKTETVERDRIGEWLPDFEDALDKFDPNFNPYNYITSKNVPKTYVTRIRDYYQRIVDEVKAALEKTDSQIVEAYSKMKKQYVVAYGKYVLMIVDDCERFMDNSNKTRAPRKPKVKSAAQLLKNFKYLKEEPKLKLVSVNPEQIFGAQELFTLNIVQNTLTRFVAKDEMGFSINRTSITNYDENLTQTKKIGRKLDATLKLVLDGNKKQRTTVLDTVKSGVVRTSDRINNNTLLIKVVKQ